MYKYKKKNQKRRWKNTGERVLWHSRLKYGRHQRESTPLSCQLLLNKEEIHLSDKGNNSESNVVYGLDSKLLRFLLSANEHTVTSNVTSKDFSNIMFLKHSIQKVFKFECYGKKQVVAKVNHTLGCTSCLPFAYLEKCWLATRKLIYSVCWMFNIAPNFNHLTWHINSLGYEINERTMPFVSMYVILRPYWQLL